MDIKFDFLGDLNPGAIAGIAIASLFVALLLFWLFTALFIYFACFKKSGIFGKAVYFTFSRNLENYKIDYSWWDGKQTQKLILKHDKETLIGHLIKTKNTKKVAVVIHGYFGNYKDLMPQAQILLEKGYNILAPELRAHGESSGRNITMGYFEKTDIVLWIDELIEIFGKDCEIVLIGESMGAAIACMVAGESFKKNVKCVIADSAYSNAYEEIKYLIKKWGKLPPFPILQLVNYMVKIFNKYDLKKVNPRNSVKSTDLPILFVHGTSDRFVPVWMSKDMYAQSNKDKCQIYLVENAGHIKSFVKDTKKYTQIVSEFVDKWIK